jgi:hypothetical protein
MNDYKQETKGRWEEAMTKLEGLMGSHTTDVNAVLYLIGVQELGQGIREFTKEEKQDLIHIAICKVFSLGGFYELEGTDQDGWPHWKPIKNLPYLSLKDQEMALKNQICDYLDTEIF